MTTTVWSSTAGTTVTQSLADQAATSATNAASSAAAAATSATEAAASASAGLAKVSSNDTTAAVLSSKIVGSSTLTVTETNDGSNETLTLATTGLLASASPTVSSGTLTLTSSGLTFSDGTTQTTASSGGGGGSSSLIIADEGSDLSTATSKIDFVGAGVTASGSGANKTVTIPGGGSGITVQDEGSALSSLGTTLNFVGSGVTATGNGATKTITISSGGGGGGGSSLTIKEEGSALSTAAASLDFVGAGVTASGTGADKTISIPGGIASLSADTNATLGSNLDVATFDIVTESSNRNVEVAAHGTGYFRIKGNDNPSKIAFLCEQNSHEITLSAPAHSSSSAYALTLPTSLSAGAVFTSSGGQLSTGDLPVADGGTGASDAAGAQQNLGLQIGTDVQAYDAGLNSIAGLTTSADKMIYTTGSDTYAVTTISAAGRAILDDADAAAMRSTLGLGTMAVAATSDYVAKAGSTMTGQLVLHSTGIQFSDSTTLTTAPTSGVSAGKAIALAMIFGG